MCGTTMDKPAFLLVDDEVTVLRALERGLKTVFSPTYEIFTAIDVSMALLIANQLGPRLVLLIADQQLGGLKGTDMARSIRYHNPKVEVIILTGYVDMTSFEGFDVLGKPISNEDLAEKVASKLASVIPG